MEGEWKGEWRRIAALHKATASGEKGEHLLQKDR